MATGGESSIEGSDIYYEFCCSLCEKKDKNVEAVKMCEDCDVNLCGDCLVSHNIFPAMREHLLVNKQDSGTHRVQDGARPDVLRVKCDKHPSNTIELYCRKHDDVGCANCGNIDHKLCKDMHYIPDVSVGIKTSCEPRDVADSLGILVNRTARVKKAREEDLRRITDQRDNAIQTIEQRVDDIKQRLDELKVAAITEVDTKFRELEQPITRDLERSGEVFNKLEKEQKRLRAAKNVGESDLFIYVKQCGAGIREGEKLVQELEMSLGEYLHVVVDDTVLACVNGLEMFVKVGDFSELALSFEQKPSVRMKDDKRECTITDCCFLDNGAILLTDFGNECVKLFDNSYRALDRCTVKVAPTAVCVVGEDEVAITLLNRFVHFATVDRKIRLARSWSVGKRCRGVSFSNNRLAFSCGGGGEEGPGQVRTFDIGGFPRQTIEHDNLDVPRHIMTNKHSGYVVANTSKGVLAFDNESGKFKISWQFKHADLKDARGICEVDGRLLVCCWKNGHVFQVNPEDQSSKILLRGSAELKKPSSLTYDRCHNKLIVTKSDCDHLLVYTIRK